MSVSRFGKLIAIAAVLAIGPAALAQAPTEAPEDGAAFQCSDGTKMVLSFTQPRAESDADPDAESSEGISALVWLHGANYRLDYLPPEPGPVQVAWSDGEHELTWSPGVHLMWMANDTHLMCGRSVHKH
ncbi:MAG: hypothetical protein ABMA14_11180 [Hyphomonadaceae bacterium]